jgi:hypothetical protein
MDATHADARDAVSDGSGPFSLVDRGCRALVRRNLAWFTDGEIQVTDSGGSRTFGAMRDEALRARIEVHNPRTYRAVALGGSIGAAEAYADGWWTADELTAMIRIMARNRDAAGRLEGWSTWLAGSSQRSVQLWLVFMAIKPSIINNLRGLSTPSVSGEELQAPGECGHSRRRNREGPAGSRG